MNSKFSNGYASSRIGYAISRIGYAMSKIGYSTIRIGYTLSRNECATKNIKGYCVKMMGLCAIPDACWVPGR